MNEAVSLKEYIESLVHDVKDSVKTAYASMEKRLEGMNEFRDQLKDQASRFITREEMNSAIKNTSDRVDANQKQIDELRLSRALLEGKASQGDVNRAFLISCVGIILGILSLLSRFFL